MDMHDNKMTNKVRPVDGNGNIPRKSRKKSNKQNEEKYIKQNIPVSLKNTVWVHYNGKVFETKCFITWCENTITVFSFEAGHDIPESKGGSTTLDNLKPICSCCNKSMGNRYTIKEWCEMFGGSTNTQGDTDDRRAVSTKEQNGQENTKREKWWKRIIVCK